MHTTTPISLVFTGPELGQPWYHDLGRQCDSRALYGAKPAAVLPAQARGEEGARAGSGLWPGGNVFRAAGRPRDVHRPGA